MGDSALFDVAAPYGWIFILVVILLRETLPLLSKLFFPAINRRAEAEISAMEDERRHRMDMERRSVDAIEKIADNTEQTRRIISSIQAFIENTNARLARLERATEQTNLAISVLLENIGDGEN